MADNLAFSCLDCNRSKGPDLAALDPLDGTVTPLFNPRIQRWEEHFVLENVHILGRTPVGRATVYLLRFNDDARLFQRLVLRAAPSR